MAISEGAKNKAVQSIRDALLEALNAGNGATAYSQKLKETDPRTFCGLIGKLVPKKLVGKNGPDLVPRSPDHDEMNLS